MDVWFFWQRGRGAVGRQIARLSRVKGVALEDTPSHMGLLFRNGEVYEAHARTGGWTDTTRDELELEGIADGCRFWSSPIPLTRRQAADCLLRARSQLFLHDYDFQGVFRLYLRHRFRIPVRPSSGRWFCSEGASRVAAPWFDMRTVCREQGMAVGVDFDGITPAMALEALIRAGNPVLDRLPAFEELTPRA